MSEKNEKAHTKPDRPAVGQRWRFTANTWEVEDPKNKEGGRVVLRQVQDDIPKGEKRSVEWDRLCLVYEYLGDFSVPEGYSIHGVLGWMGHCFKTPAGNVHGPPRGTSWTWKQARDAAVAEFKRGKPPPGYKVGFFAGDNDWRWKTRNAAMFGFATKSEAITAAWTHFEGGADAAS